VTSRPFYNTDDPCVAVRVLIEKHGGDKRAAILALFGESCSYESARQMSVLLARCFDMDESDFMGLYRGWKSRWKKKD
jgi:hypothetical protein